MKQNPLLRLSALGQSLWLDYLRRGILTGELQKLIDEDGLKGETSNPTIFDKAISGSHDYDDAIAALAPQNKDATRTYEALVVDDVQRAADLFLPVYIWTGGQDGYVSLEVNPHLAYDTAGTIAEARHLWQAVKRPNIFIKVPGTTPGLAAITQLISEGININVTLLFGLPRYRQVADAYMSGLEAREAKGKPLAGTASVASFFLSRIDVLVDSMLDKIIEGGGDKAKTAGALRGQIAIASARAAYQIYKEIIASERFRRLEDCGARRQRLLWASTSTKSPEYSDVKYVDDLIGTETINSMPPETMDAYRDHGNPAPRLEENMQEAYRNLSRLAEAGIDLDSVTDRLEREGVKKFSDSYDQLLATLGQKLAAHK